MAEAGADPARHRGTRAVQRLVEFAPATGGLALWIRHRDVRTEGGAAAAPAVACDGACIRYGPAFDALPLPRQAGLVAAAVLHVALRHSPRMAELRALLGDIDSRLFNVCADAVVHSALGHLGWLELPPQAVRLDRLLASALDEHASEDAALLRWDVESLYRAIDDRRPPARPGGRRDDGPRAAITRALGHAGGAELLPVPDAERPDAAAASPHAPEAQAEATRLWHERLLRAHAGDGAFSMLRGLLADLPQPHTPWEQVLRTQLARGLSARPALSWSRPSRSYIANHGRAGPGRRMPWQPGTGGTAPAPRLVVVVDTSGSVDDVLLARFTSEVRAIVRRLDAALVLVAGDDRVREVRHCRPGHADLGDLNDLALPGGGGTDFAPLLQEAERHRPDIGVVLTDLQGPASFRPRWPVVWAVPVPAGAALPAAPFGRVLALR